MKFSTQKSCLKMMSQGRFPVPASWAMESLYKSDIARLHGWCSAAVLYHLYLLITWLNLTNRIRDRPKVYNNMWYTSNHGPISVTTSKSSHQHQPGRYTQAAPTSLPHSAQCLPTMKVSTLLFLQVTTTISLLFIPPPCQASPWLITAIRALDKALDFFQDNYDHIILDGIYGLRVAEGEFALICLCLIYLHNFFLYFLTFEMHTLRKVFVILQLYWFLFSSTKHCSWNLL